MHGSVTWRRFEQDGRARVVRGEPNLEGEMIYPSYQKYDESRQQPYSAFTDRLSRFPEMVTSPILRGVWKVTWTR
jgi:hypothetical protein